MFIYLYKCRWQVRILLEVEALEIAFSQEAWYVLICFEDMAYVLVSFF